MKHVAVLLSFLLFTSTLLADDSAQGPKPVRVGQIFIAGNTVTRDNVILRQVPFFPGQVLSVDDVRTAEKNLDRLKLFKVKCKIEVLDADSDSTFKDLLIVVEERRSPSDGFGRYCLDVFGVPEWLEERRGTNPLVGVSLELIEIKLDRLGTILRPPVTALKEFAERLDRYSHRFDE